MALNKQPSTALVLNDSQLVCDQYRANITELIGHRLSISPLDHVVLPAICIFGILGNVLNLYILSRKHMKISLDRMEHSVYLGLMSLAGSDMVQCLFMLTLLYKMPEYVNPLSVTQQIHAFFYTYRLALCNIFLFNSTWLTVLMAIGRYIAICHPMRARSFVKTKVTIILILLILVCSTLVSLPYFWQFYLVDYTCIDAYRGGGPTPADCQCLIPYRQESQDHVALHKSYHYFWMVFEFVIPLGTLVFCNICLIRSLKQSFQMQQQCRANQAQDPSLRITPTLVAVILFFIILISPAEILKFIPKAHWTTLSVQNNVKSVSNILQALNAAVNFILYCVINVHFRHTIQQIMCCKKDRARGRLVGSLRSDQIRTNHTSIMYDAETEL